MACCGTMLMVEKWVWKRQVPIRLVVIVERLSVHCDLWNGILEPVTLDINCSILKDFPCDNYILILRSGTNGAKHLNRDDYNAIHTLFSRALCTGKIPHIRQENGMSMFIPSRLLRLVPQSCHVSPFRMNKAFISHAATKNTLAVHFTLHNKGSHDLEPCSQMASLLAISCGVHR